MEKIDFRTVSSKERYNIRKRAIALIKSGETQKGVALIFGVRTNTVSDWAKQHK